MSQIASLPQRQTEPLIRPRADLRSADLSVVIPTFKESGNIAPLLERMETALTGIAWEAIFVDDDSPDGTAAVVKAIALTDPRVRCLKRVSRRGLAGACIEGILSSSAPYVAVMDADLQHDEQLLARMFALLKTGDSDMVVGSRYAAGGSSTEGLSRSRGFASRVATGLAQRFCRVRISDPLSGFFMLRRECFDPLAPSLSTQGFKILLDILITAKGSLRIAEEPYVFSARTHGESKLDAQVGADFLGLLLTKLTGGAVTPRFLSFAGVGTIGLGVHLLVLRTALVFGLLFPAAQTLATIVAMTGNFLLNNVLTYRDRRLTGLRLIGGLFGFYAISAVGALANVGVASWIYAHDSVWWMAGLAGAVMGAVWNYSMSTLLVWRVK